MLHAGYIVFQLLKKKRIAESVTLKLALHNIFNYAVALMLLLFLVANGYGQPNVNNGQAKFDLVGQMTSQIQRVIFGSAT